MIQTNKVSSKVGYFVLGIMVGIFFTISYIAKKAEIQADLLVDKAYGIQSNQN